MGQKFENSDATCAWVREQTDTIVCPFSRGKDSVAVYLQLRRFFDKDKIFLAYYGSVTDRNGNYPTFVEESLEYFEAAFETRIYRLIHGQFFRMLCGAMYQPPDRVPTLQWLMEDGFLRPPPKGNSKMNEFVLKLPFFAERNAWAGIGIRMSDSLARRTTVLKNGAAFPDRRLFYPIWDWGIARVAEEIKAAGIMLPIDYRWFGRSWDSFDVHVLKALLEHEPESYDTVLEWFPLAHADIARYNFRAILKEQGYPTP